MKKQTDAYWVLKLWAVIAVLVASIATYDIAYHFTPAGVAIFGIAISRSTISTFTILVVDGLYIMLDLMLPKFRTANSRASAGYFMVLLWGVMLSLNIASAVINKSIDISALGDFSFVVYFVKALAVIYLAWYTYVRYDDPETQRELVEMETREAREKGINTHLKTYSDAFARQGAQIIAMEKMADYVFHETGKDISEVLGPNWREVLGGQGFAPTGNPTDQSVKTKTVHYKGTPINVSIPIDKEPMGLLDRAKAAGKILAGNIGNGNGHKDF